MDNKHYKRSMFGFNPNDVYDHIESLYLKFDNQLKEKDQEIDRLNQQNAFLSKQLEELKDKFAGIEDYKSNIADVLLKAKEQGAEIIKEAEKEGLQRKTEISRYYEIEKSKLNEYAEDIKNIRTGIIEVLNKYLREIDQVSSRVDDTESSVSSLEDEVEHVETNENSSENE